MCEHDHILGNVNEQTANDVGKNEEKKHTREKKRKGAMFSQESETRERNGTHILTHAVCVHFHTNKRRYTARYFYVYTNE